MKPLVFASALAALFAISAACVVPHPTGGSVDLRDVPAKTLAGALVAVDGSTFNRTWGVSLCLPTSHPPSTCSVEGFVQQFDPESDLCEHNWRDIIAPFFWNETADAAETQVRDTETEGLDIQLFVRCGTTPELVLDGPVRMQQVAINAFAKKTIVVMDLRTSAACSQPLVMPSTAAATPTSTTPELSPTPQPTTLPPATRDPTALNVLVVFNFRWTTMPVADLSAALERYVARTLNADQRRRLVASFVDSGDSVLSVAVNLVAVMNNMTDLPDVVVVVDSTDVTVTVQNALRATPQTASVPVVSAFSAGLDVLDAIARPLTMSIVPSDAEYLRAVNEIMLRALNWGAVAVIYTQNTFGRDLMAALDAHIAIGGVGPAILVRAPLLPSGTDATDDDVIAKLLLYKPTAVLCLVSQGVIARIRAAMQRNVAASRLFLAFPATALQHLPSLTGSPTWGVALLPSFTRVSGWAMNGIVADPTTLDEPAAFMLSFTFDALRVASNAWQILDIRGAPLLDLMKSITFENGFTGRISFNAAGQRASSSTVALVASAMDQPLAAWTRSSAADPTPVLQLDTPRIRATIVPSPLQAITVCLAATPNCPAVANLNHALFALLDHNRNGSLLGNSTIVPIAINAGYEGVDGLRRLLPIASRCNFIMGPGSSVVNFALAPVINQFRIPQIDYTASSTAFSDKRRFPFFSRVVPTDLMRAAALTSALAHFAWERILLLTTDNEYGTSVIEGLDSVLARSPSILEASYRLTNLSPATMRAALQDIKDVAIGRIVAVMFSGTTQDSYNFFQVVQEMGMNETHIFFLGDAICQHALAFPEMRASLIGSICMAPIVDGEAYTRARDSYTSGPLAEQMQDVLISGGFDASCPLSFDDAYGAFAFDAATLLVRTVTGIAQATSNSDNNNNNNNNSTEGSATVAEHVAASNSTFTVAMMRSQQFQGITGPVAIDDNGDRTLAAFEYNIQQPNALIVRFAQWRNDAPVSFTVLQLAEPLRWFGNSTTIPTASTRSIGFIALQTAKAHPATIALSVLGFIATIAVFFFCYRHYRLQKMLEMQSIDGAATVGGGGGGVPQHYGAPSDIPPSYNGDTVELRKK